MTRCSLPARFIMPSRRSLMVPTWRTKSFRTTSMLSVGFLVREIAAHGHGGILIISPDEHPSVAESAPYRMSLDSSLAALLRLAWRIRGKGGDGPSTRARPRELRMDSSTDTGAAGSENPAFG